MQKEELKFQDSLIFEGMTSIRALIRSIDEKKSDRRIEEIIFDKSKLQKISKEIGYFKAVSSKYGFKLVESTTEEMDNLTLGTSHGGIIARCGKRTFLSVGDIPKNPRGFYAMIQGIEDPYNFGYALRSLYACGCNGIILPLRNWMSAAGVVCRASAGASELFDIYVGDATEVANHFKQLGYSIVCAEEKTDNVLGECPLPLPLLLIVGGEKRGISASILAIADKLVKINYARDFRASLSAASAATMFAFEIMRQNSK